MGFELLAFLFLFVLGLLGIGLGMITREGFFVLWGAIFLLLAASGAVYFNGLLLGHQVSGFSSTESGDTVNYQENVWAYSDPLLFWFINSLFVISGVSLFSMIGSKANTTKASVWNW